jgi:hypothetical protein
MVVIFLDFEGNHFAEHGVQESLHCPATSVAAFLKRIPTP